MGGVDEQGSGGRPRSPGRRARPIRLEDLLGTPVPAREAAMWAALDVEGRAKAAQRAKALIRWADGEAGVPARTAAADAGVTLVRFYQMAARWRSERSLASLGVGAAPERGRRSQFKPEVNAVLQKAVVGVMDHAGGEGEVSLRRLALRLAEVAADEGVAAEDLPSHNTLRAIVEREVRRRRRKREVGNALLLDHAPCGVLRADGSPWTLFAIVDAASQLVLGAAPGDAAEASAGYRDAARDARRRIADGSLAALLWSDRLAGVQIVPGGDGGEPLREVIAGAAAVGVGVNLTADRKAGRYLEEHVGRALGVLPIWPYRAASTTLPPWADQRAPRLDADRATGRIQLAVDDHNAELVPDLACAGTRELPRGLLDMLDLLTR